MAQLKEEQLHFSSLSEIVYHDDSCPWCEHNLNARVNILIATYEHLMILIFNVITSDLKYDFCSGW
jgi:hypothetical protein